jgi:hypothetical protein
LEKIKAFLQNKKAVAIVAVALVLVLGSSLAFAGVFGGGDSKEAADSKAPSELTADGRDIEDITDEELVDSISYYNESAKTKEEIEKEFAPAVTIVKQRIEQKKAPVEPDLDNQEYREFIIGSSMDLDGLSPQEQKQMAELGKEVADYDNKFVNKRIKELEDKAKTDGLKAEEKSELLSLLPAKDPVPLKPGKEHKSDSNADTGVDKEKKGITTPPADSEQGTEESGNSGQEQPAPADEEESNSDNEEQQPPAPGDETTEAEQTPPSSGSDEGTEEEQPTAPSNEEEVVEEETPGNEESEGTGSEEGTNDEENNEEEPAEVEEPAEETDEYTNGYQPEQAIAYAYQWWNKRNNDEYGYYSRAWGGCYNCWPDCTNFTSQVLKAGGLVEWKSGPTQWFYNDNKPSVSWGLANGQYRHLRQRAEPAAVEYELKVGDIVHADLNGDGRINHAAVVSKVENGQVFVTQHTNDRKDHPLSVWFQNEYIIYGAKMSTADNNPR